VLVTSLSASLVAESFDVEGSWLFKWEIKACCKCSRQGGCVLSISATPVEQDFWTNEWAITDLYTDYEATFSQN